MSADTFIDTNVLAYGFDDESPDKQAIARELIASADFVISTQVLGELYVTLTRKLVRKVPADVAHQALIELQALDVVPITAGLVLAATETSVRWQLSYWDSLIIEAAAKAGCITLLTEDLNDQAVINGVRIVNPFASLSPEC